jgi:hypothetical protein
MSDLVEPVADVAPEPDASPADDLRAAIAAAWDEHAGEAEPEASEPVAAERDERGRFASRDTETSEAEDRPAEEVTQEAAVPTPAEPPASPVDAVLERYKPLYAARGIAPDAALSGLFEAQKVLEERPYEAIQVLARQYGVDLSKFAPAAQSQQAAPPTNDPAVNAALQEVRAIRAEIEAQKQQTVEAENARVHLSIATFAADPKHVHFPAVRTAMGALMQAGIANDLPTAYEMACRAHPEVHKAIQAAEAERRAKSETEAKRKAAADAKGKAVSVRGAPPVTGFRQAPDSIRDTLLAAWDGRLN